jgi:hypothetical protein
MNSFVKLAASTAIAALLVPGIVAAEDDAPVGTAAFESVSVEGGAGIITAKGVTTFGGETVLVASDATGDGTVPGTDIGDLTMGQDVDSGDLIFSMELADGLPTTGTIPVGLYYSWTVFFPGAGDIALRATWAQYDAPDTEFNFDVAVTVDGTFTPTVVSGEYDGTHLIWNVPTAVLGAQPGHAISGLAEVNMGGAGVFTLNGQSHDDVATGNFAVGGGARMVVKDAAGEIVDEATAKVRRGEFTAVVKDLAPGTYTVEVLALYGDASVTKTFTTVVS